MDNTTSPRLKRLLKAANSKKGVEALVFYLQDQIENKSDYEIAWTELSKIKHSIYFDFAVELLHYLIGITDEIPCLIDDASEVEGRTWKVVKNNFPDIEAYAETKEIILNDEDVISIAIFRRIRSYIEKQLAQRKDSIGLSKNDSISEYYLSEKYKVNNWGGKASKGMPGNYRKLIYNRPKS
jgi:hypothetical protein